MLSVLFLALLAPDPLGAQVITFEGNSFPEMEGWARLPDGAPHGVRAIEDGWFVQTVRLPEGWAGPTGEQDSYRTDLTDFTGVNRFFLEWRAVTDNPAWLIDFWQTPAVVAAGGNAASLYHTVMTDSAAAFLRDIRIPRVIAPVSMESAHVFRVEVYPGEYIWYIDGTVTDIGTPEGAYPDSDARLTWGVNRDYVDATTAWDYLRCGIIPEDGSGDYDSDGKLTLFDYYFTRECVSKSGPQINAGPGCRFADFDGDGDVDLLDFASFQILFAGTHP